MDYAGSLDSSRSIGPSLIEIAILMSASVVVAAIAFWTWKYFKIISNRTATASPPDEHHQLFDTMRKRFGLSEESLNKLPVVSYVELVKFKESPGRVGSCAVCLQDFNEDDQRIRHLPRCGHSFHLDCIEMWFHSHSSCPVCRDSLLDPESLV